MIRMNRNVSIFSVVVVMIVTVLATVAVALAQEEPRDEPQNENGGGLGLTKITICHKGHVITVAKPAWPAHDRHGDTIIQENLEDTSIQENPEDTCGNEGALPEGPSEGATLTTDATDTATLPDGTISDMATLEVPDDTTGTIEFKLYGPFAADATIGEDDCVDPDPEADPPVAGNLVFTDTEDVPTDKDAPAGSGKYTSDSFTPTAAGKYQWVATFTPDQQEVDPASTPCGEEAEQSVVSEAATTATEQNMTLAAEIGGAANPADPATDITNIEGTNQNDSTTLGPDSDDVLIGDPSANILLGREGNDILDGGRGRDRMVGGRGNDYINGADGKPGDVLNGGIGKDFCVGDKGDDFKNCDGNVVVIGVPDL